MVFTGKAVRMLCTSCTLQRISDELTGFSHEVSESAPCEIGMRLDSKILGNLMVYQRSVFGMSMKLLVKGAIGGMFGMGRCRAIRAQVFIFCHLVGNCKLAAKRTSSNAEEKKNSKHGIWARSLVYSKERTKDIQAIKTAHRIRGTGPPCKTRLYIPSCIRSLASLSPNQLTALPL